MMDTNSKTGRQEVIAAYADFDIEDFKNALGVVITTAIPAFELPQGAMIVGGSIVCDTLFDGTTPALAIGDDDDDTPDEDRYLAAGSLAAADTAVPITNADGVQTVGACNLTLKLSASDSTVGAGRICVQYVVKGRTAFSQG